MQKRKPMDGMLAKCYMALINRDADMASLHVRNVDNDIVERLKERASMNGRSAEAEHREILREALRSKDPLTFDEMAALLRQRLAGRAHTPSEILQREGRDER